jgi:hypothetical protein
MADDRDRLTDAEIHRAVHRTIVDVLLPAIGDDSEWARAAAIQLAGLARYAERRGVDRTEARVAELGELLATIATNELVAEHWDGGRTQRSVMGAAGAVLAAAVDRHDAAADEARRTLRPVVVRQLDDELAETAPLVDAFRGKLHGR